MAMLPQPQLAPNQLQWMNVARSGPSLAIGAGELLNAHAARYDADIAPPSSETDTWPIAIRAAIWTVAAIASWAPVALIVMKL